MTLVQWLRSWWRRHICAPDPSDTWESSYDESGWREAVEWHRRAHRGTQ